VIAEELRSLKVPIHGKLFRSWKRDAPSPDFSVRLKGADHQWGKDPLK
jgi:hypothetical protein